jgi:F0F1-type ATP synthase assembly protein I
MSWQLLIVVVVPVLVGHYVDEHFKLTPWCTVAGMVLSLLGMVTVVKLTLKELNTYMKIDEKESK